MPLDAERPEHRSQRQTEIEQNRTLFDVEFDIGSGIVQFVTDFFRPPDPFRFLGPPSDEFHPCP